MSTDDHQLIDQLLDVVPTEATPGNRLKRLDAKYRAPEKLSKLQPRHLLMIDYMINGLGSPTRARQLRVGVGVPMTLLEAADAARVRRREARRIALDQMWRGELSRQLRAWREQLAPEATQIIAAIARDPGQGLAADRKVQLSAASVLTGDSGNSGGGGGGTNVQINLGGAGKITAGIVIRMPPTAKRTPGEPEPEPETLELQAVTEPAHHNEFAPAPDGLERLKRRVTESD
jgi:hypothetical protein